jgi:hypothetical protein
MGAAAPGGFEGGAEKTALVVGGVARQDRQVDRVEHPGRGTAEQGGQAWALFQLSAYV